MIPVIKPFLPPIGDYETYLSGIWKRNWLTNMGPLANELELKLKGHLKVKHLLFVSSGTMGLQIAIKALGLKGEILTTPFSFVATSSSITWEGCTPVFVDIDRKSLNLDAEKIEAAITEKTVAILATHVYGNPCDVDAIQKVADKHGLKVIYDAAHSFGVNLYNQSIFNYGDISICSLHATKLYHSVEGGLIITRDPVLLKKMAYMRNFGFAGPEAFAELGINGKNSELHAAMGLVNLKYITDIHDRRRQLTHAYDKMLGKAKAHAPSWHSGATMNYAYYPLIFESEQTALRVFDALKRREIFVRRYFYPSLAKVLPYVSPKVMPITEDVAKRVLCLPMFYDLSLEEVDLISRIILRVLNN